jgi:hypothetical protein
MSDSSSGDVEESFVDRLGPLFKQPPAGGHRFAVNPASMA